MSLEELKEKSWRLPSRVYAAPPTRTVSSTGGEKDVKPEALDQIPVVALRELGRVFAYGEQKYARDNWKKGYEYSKSYAAAQRHLTAWWMRENEDPESGLSHLMHAAWHLFTLYWRERVEKDGGPAVWDDRPNERKARWE